MIFVLREDCFEGAEGEAGRGERGDVVGHDLGDWDTEGVFFFVVQKGEAVEPDHSIRNASFSEPFADCLSDPYDDLTGICQLPTET